MSILWPLQHDLLLVNDSRCIPTTVNRKLSPETDGGMTLVICGNLRFIQKKLKFIKNWPQYAVDQIRFTLDMWFCWESNQHQQMDLSGFAFLGITNLLLRHISIKYFDISTWQHFPSINEPNNKDLVPWPTTSPALLQTTVLGTILYCGIVFYLR